MSKKTKTKSKTKSKDSGKKMTVRVIRKSGLAVGLATVCDPGIVPTRYLWENKKGVKTNGLCKAETGDVLEITATITDRKFGQYTIITSPKIEE
jgi:hypothetical protein